MVLSSLEHNHLIGFLVGHKVKLFYSIVNINGFINQVFPQCLLSQCQSTMLCTTGLLKTSPVCLLLFAVFSNFIPVLTFTSLLWKTERDSDADTTFDYKSHLAIRNRAIVICQFILWLFCTKTLPQLLQFNFHVLSQWRQNLKSPLCTNNLLSPDIVHRLHKRAPMLTSFSGLFSLHQLLFASSL